MSSVTVKFRGILEEILDKMVEYGIAETKSEAIRVAILNFGIEMGLLSEQGLIKSLREQLAECKISQEKVAEEIERVKIESIR
jgi:Arc/MetJ-type ribon-helix-helix transcriptional regulator